MPYNVLNYSINADTAFHKGDLILRTKDNELVCLEAKR